MTNRRSQSHPAVLLAVYLFVPLAINVAVIAVGEGLFVQQRLLILRAPGVIVGIQWGVTGMAFCALVGFLIGLPVAMLQVAYLRDKLGAAKAEALPGRSFLSTRYVLSMTLPWLVAFVAGHLLGDSLVFRPVGGALIAADVFLARVLVYRSHRAAWAYVVASRAAEEGARVAWTARTDAVVGAEQRSARQI